MKQKREARYSDTVKSRLADEDEWALEWININRLQAIIEAFDDDASGFITVEEVNYFTTSRPKEWRYGPGLPRAEQTLELTEGLR